jgi:hypothetical protein
MAQFHHSICNHGVVMTSKLDLIILSFGEADNGLNLSPAKLDIRVIDEEGNIKMSDAGAVVSPSWFCPTCKSKVPEEEIMCDCFGCGGKHAISEMVNTMHTTPVRMDCYDIYRESHPQEGYPKTPKVMPLLESLRALTIKF